MASVNHIVSGLIAVVVLGLSAFHLYTAAFGVFPGSIQRPIHWMLIAILIFVTQRTKAGQAPEQSARRIASWARGIIGLAGIAVTVYGCLYLIINYESILMRYGAFTETEVWLGALFTLAVLEAGRRTLGWPLPLLCVAFIVYAFIGPYLPGLLGHRGYSFERLATYLFFGTDGIFGVALGVSATFIFLFMLFGGILEASGAGKFFVDIAFALTGRVPGGPAQAAVLSSALMGTVSGSGVANVVTTGTFTIPLMKRTGYAPHFAGAVEAVASNGGQILPPVMGAVAFLMAEILGVPYVEVAKAALIPAVLYFVTLSAAVYFEARREKLVGLPAEELPDWKRTLREGWYYLIPLAVLVVYLVLGYSAMRAAFYGIVAMAALMVLKRGPVLRQLIDAAREAAMTSLPVAAACACSGIIIGVMNLTGLGPKLSTLIVSISGGTLFIALVLTMLVSLVLGMGLPTSAAYLVLAVLGGPALIELGVQPMAAHLFILYFGCLSTITPPVALSAFAAAGIAGASPMKTGLTALRLATVAFLIPFMFVYGPSLLMQGTSWEIIQATLSALIGSVLLSVAVIGWFLTPLGAIPRLFAGAASLLLIHPGWTTDLIGIVILGVFALVARAQLRADTPEWNRAVY